MNGNQDSASFRGEPCGCFTGPPYRLDFKKDLGLDVRFAEVTLLACPACGQRWLRYFYEVEAFTASGRWYLGAITPEQAASLTAEGAKAVLEGLEWYFYGGSYFDGKSGKASGRIF
jgi:hypothetical protein